MSMDVQNLVDRILKDAKDEAAIILRDAKKNAKENLEYANKHQEELLKSAKENAKREKAREREINESEQSIRDNLALLHAKTQIVDDVFDKAMQKIKYNFKVEKKPNYELRMTREELGATLRLEIEKQVVEILFQ
ncbi:MAG: hypothetical protein LBG88_01435 [Christensenellaceae bacterium]|jgi:vacuolar-type H+-ATPase subunit E/Vma4|nr:hypothetical protein [Christensenellaceae bacterium]